MRTQAYEKKIAAVREYIDTRLSALSDGIDEVDAEVSSNRLSIAALERRARIETYVWAFALSAWGLLRLAIWLLERAR